MAGKTVKLLQVTVSEVGLDHPAVQGLDDDGAPFISLPGNISSADAAALASSLTGLVTEPEDIGKIQKTLGVAAKSAGLYNKVPPF